MKDYASVKNRAIYDELFGEFVNIYRNNRAMYGRLNGGNRA